MMELASKVAYNAFIQIISRIISTILGLAAVAIMARSLGRAGFGEYTTVITFLSFFGIMSDLGLTLVTAQMISRKGVEEQKILNNLFSLRFFSALLFLGLAPAAILLFSYSHNIKTGVAIVSLSFFFTALNQILIGFLQKKLRMDIDSISEVLGRVVLVAGIFLSARQNWGFSAMMAAVAVSGAVNFFSHLIMSGRLITVRFAFDWSLWGEIIKKSWPIAVTIIFNLIYLKTDTLLLSLLKESWEVGIYGAAYKVIEVLTMLPFMISGVILPILSYNWSVQNIEYFKKILQKCFDLMLIIAIPLIVGAQFLAVPIMNVVAGEDFAAAGPVLRILIIAAGLVFLSCLLAHAIIAIDKQKETIWAYFFTAATSVAGYFIFIPKYSYFGAAGVTIYSELAITMFMFYYIYNFSKIKLSWRIFPKIATATAIMGAALYLVPDYFSSKALGILTIVAGATAVYFSALYFNGGLAKNDLKIFKI